MTLHVKNCVKLRKKFIFLILILELLVHTNSYNDLIQEIEEIILVTFIREMDIYDYTLYVYSIHTTAAIITKHIYHLYFKRKLMKLSRNREIIFR